MDNTVIEPEKIMEERRGRINITLAEPLIEYIDAMRDGFFIVDGKGKKIPYPRSYMVEDLLVFVLSDVRRIKEFQDWFEKERLEGGGDGKES